MITATYGSLQPIPEHRLQRAFLHLIHCLSAAHYNLGRQEESLAYEEKALQMRQVLFGDEPHPDLAARFTIWLHTYLI